MPHYTSGNHEAFTERVTFDFIAQLAQRLESYPLSQAELAKRLGVSESEVSQVLNLNRINLTLKTMVRYAFAAGMKVAVVAYDDGDPSNENGPVGSEIFSATWDKLGKPKNVWNISEKMQSLVNASALTGFAYGWQGLEFFNSTLESRSRVNNTGEILYVPAFKLNNEKASTAHARS